MSDEPGTAPVAPQKPGRGTRIGMVVAVLVLIAVVVHLRGQKEHAAFVVPSAVESPAEPVSAAPGSSTAAAPDTVPAAARAAAGVAARTLRRSPGADSSAPRPAPTAAASMPPASPPRPAAETTVRRSLPRLVDLGAHSCIPCRMMAPILEDLRAHYGDRFATVFIDVWQDPEAGAKYGIRAIPTQIFFDENGRELYRHEGFFSKADILATWQRLGYAF